MEEEDYDYDFTVNLKIEEIQLLYYCVQEAIKYWPGAPARPYEEQEKLWEVRDNLYRMILEHKFNSM